MRRICVVLLLIATAAHADYREFRALSVDPALQSRLRRAAAESLREFPALNAEDLAISVVDITNPLASSRADYNGGTSFYPASVIKIFHMADIYLQRKQSVGDVGRALKEMIVVSDN